MLPELAWEIFIHIGIYVPDLQVAANECKKGDNVQANFGTFNSSSDLSLDSEIIQPRSNVT